MTMELNERSRKLLVYISEKNMLQAKALNGLEERMIDEEKEGLNALLEYYTAQGDTVEYLADCYLHHIEDFMEEEYFFMRNGRYRYSSGSEVNAFFYQNPEYMEYYMKGLAISTYLLEYHRHFRTWFCEKISAKYNGGGYTSMPVWDTENTSCWLSTTRIMSDTLA